MLKSKYMIIFGVNTLSERLKTAWHRAFQGFPKMLIRTSGFRQITRRKPKDAHLPRAWAGIGINRVQ